MLEEKPFTEDDIKKEEQGRPFFPDRETDFNISHSGNLAAVSLVKDGGMRTGCDVELVRPRKRIKEIAEKFFTASEREFIFDAEFFDEAKFFMIWTLKECYLKLKGMSVFDMKEAPSFIERGQFIFGADCSLSFYLYELSGFGERYMLASAANETKGEPELRWFSQVSFDCKSIAKINAAPSPAQIVSPKT